MAPGDASAFGVKALDQTGQQIWRKTFPGPQINPYYQLGTPDGGLLIYVDWADGTNHLLKIGPDGTQQWIQDASSFDTKIAVSSDGTIYVKQNLPQPNDAWSIAVLDPTTGNLKYQGTASLTSSTSFASAAGSPYNCNQFIPDSSETAPATYLAGPIVAANGHAYVVEGGENSSYTYTQCSVVPFGGVQHGGGGSNGNYVFTYADGTLNLTSQAALLELTPNGPGATTPIANYTYNGEAVIPNASSPLTKPDGSSFGGEWFVGGLAGDGDGGVLTQLGDEVSQNNFTRVYQNALQYSVPTTAGGGIAVSESGKAFVQRGFNEGFQSFNIADGTSLLSTSSGRILTGTDDSTSSTSGTNDGGVIMQQSVSNYPDASSIIYQVDQSGNASSSVQLSGTNFQYPAQGEVRSYDNAFGSVADIHIAQLTAKPAIRSPVPGTANLSGNKDTQEGVITKEITVIGWIRKDSIPLPDSSNVNPALLTGLYSNCLTTVGGFSRGDRHLITSDADRQFANAFLLRNSSNGEPPSTLDAVVYLNQGRDYRLFNQVKAAIATSGNQITKVDEWITADVKVGPTVDSCHSFTIALIDALGSVLDAQPHPDNGKRGITPDGLHLYQLNEARVGTHLQQANMTLNACTHMTNGLCDAPISPVTPWVWDYPRIDSTGTVVSSPGQPTNVATQTFPTLYIYVDGQLVDKRFQGDLNTFIQLNSSNSEMKAANIK